ncbi:MAG: hypothetical protein J0H09_03100 [Burkholderiales bacterium]|nr:hypothetical protein [Burkholderiales bacterium]
MERYLNLSGHSGIRAYQIHDDAIDIQFDGGSVYRYDHRHPGRDAVTNMKQLAQKGRGLNTYINKNVRNNYASRLR